MHVSHPGLGFKGILFVDNVAARPSIGDLRIAADVSLAECVRLARALALKPPAEIEESLRNHPQVAMFGVPAPR